jgi:hypothetical protein
MTLNLIDILPYLPIIWLAYRCARDGLALYRNHKNENNIAKSKRRNRGHVAGQNSEELADEQRQTAVKNAVDDYLTRNPDWQPLTKPAPKAAQVTNSKQKAARIKKSLGAGAGVFTPHVMDEEALRRAREAARAFQAADPDRYGDIIHQLQNKLYY